MFVNLPPKGRAFFMLIVVPYPHFWAYPPRSDIGVVVCLTAKKEGKDEGIRGLNGASRRAKTMRFERKYLLPIANI